MNYGLIREKFTRVSNSMLNRTLLAERIGWNKTSMSLWLSGEGKIPDDKFKALERELRNYGYKKQSSQ